VHGFIFECPAMSARMSICAPWSCVGVRMTKITCASCVGCVEVDARIRKTNADHGRGTLDTACGTHAVTDSRGMIRSPSSMAVLMVPRSAYG